MSWVKFVKCKITLDSYFNILNLTFFRVVPITQVIKESPPSSPDTKQKNKKREEKDKQL